MSERERFEAWARTQPRHEGASMRFLPLNNAYIDFDLHGAWLAWQAARSGQAASGSSQGARSDYPEAAALLCERFARDFTTTPPKNEFEHGVQTATTRLAEAFRRQPEALEPSGSTYGIIDPDYGRAYTIARKLAWEEGYAIGLHGSFTRDLDLVAVPWVEKPCEPFHLVRRIVAATGLKLRSETPGAKPQGRLVWTLLFPSFGDPRFVDFSVIPPARSGAGSEEGRG